ncbi:MAG: multicopper oxidase family protein, partial [Pseudoclavibacter sp.]
MLRPIAAALAASLIAGLAGCALMPSVSPVQEVEFGTSLAIPPLAPSRVEDGVRVFDLSAHEGETEFVPGRPTATRGYNSDHLGPTLRAERGEEVAVRIENGLTDTTTLHWHGMHLPAAMDGGPHQPIEPGEQWRPEWRIDQPAATLWYHPHPHGDTEGQVYSGLAGMFLIDDEHSLAASLPSEYGVDDIPVVVQDKDLDLETGELDHSEIGGNGAEVGLLGNVVTTNGTVGAYQEVTTERVRLRLLNGSTARVYEFGFADRGFDLVATDGGLLDEPVELDRLR